MPKAKQGKNWKTKRLNGSRGCRKPLWEKFFLFFVKKSSKFWKVSTHFRDGNSDGSPTDLGVTRIAFWGVRAASGLHRREPGRPKGINRNAEIMAQRPHCLFSCVISLLAGEPKSRILAPAIRDSCQPQIQAEEMTFPLPPNAHALAVLVLTVLALILFTREKIPLESSSFMVLISLAVGFELFPFQPEGGVSACRGLFPRFRARGAGGRLCPDDCRAGVRAHRSAGAGRSSAGPALEGQPEPFPALDSPGQCLYQRLHQQCSCRRVCFSPF